MSYQALYRKFRPRTFEEVRGQDHIVSTLKNQLRTGRIGHAYLFSGTRGTGKTTVAKILARSVNCENPSDGSPCNECQACRSILAGTSTNVIEIDAASNNGVDNIREIREEVAYRPTEGKYKVYIIDEVHMLSTGAFNALLKTLEEPPEYVIFILATTEANRIPVTILSRCQRYNFHRITADTITGRLRELSDGEGVQAEERALQYIARAADGSMRDALSLLDQCIAFYLGEELTYDRVLEVLGTVDVDRFSALLRKTAAGDASGSIRLLQDCVREGREMGQFVSDFTWYLRNLMLLQSSSDLEDVLDVSTDNLLRLREEAQMVSRDALMRYIRIFSELSGQIRFASQKQILVETALIRLCRPQMDTDLESVLERIRVLEEAVSRGVSVQEQRMPGARPGLPQDGPAAEDPPPVRAAAPEDLRKIMQEWGRIVGSAGMPLREYLKRAKPRYDAGTGSPKLYLEVRNEVDLDFFRKGQDSQNPGSIDEIAELRDLIRQSAGCEADIAVVSASDRETARHLSDLSLDDLLQDRIAVPVEEYREE